MVLDIASLNGAQ